MRPHQGIVAPGHGVKLTDCSVRIPSHLTHERWVGHHLHRLLQHLGILEKTRDLGSLLHELVQLWVHAHHRANGIRVAHHLLHHGRLHYLLHQLWVLHHHLLRLRHHLRHGVPSRGRGGRQLHSTAKHLLHGISCLCWHLLCGSRLAARWVVQQVHNRPILWLIRAHSRGILPDATGADQANVLLWESRTAGDLLLQLGNSG
mmetsp:Transcript_118493/g.297987  ORF Transcript_118493/g.297987 Transcript_118493/m.297987 type:complete len:202 (-) Transcript_118493:147-752(-)